MHHLRRSRLPALILGLVLGVAVLLPEIGHSLAHRDAALHTAPDAVLAGDDHHHGAEVVAGPGEGMVSAGRHAVEVHPHFDLRQTAPSKTSLSLFLAVQYVVDLILDPVDHQPAIPFRQGHFAMAWRNHGPPPPSRAPPLS